MMFWCLYRYGDSQVICSKHRTLSRAIDSAIECEQRGGARHTIARVDNVEFRRGVYYNAEAMKARCKARAGK